MAEYNSSQVPRKIYFEITSTHFINPSSVRFDTGMHAHDLEAVIVMAQVRRLGSLPIGTYVAERNGNAEWKIIPLPKPFYPSH